MPPKCTNTSEPKEEQLYIAVHPINNNMCDADPYTIQVI